MRGPELSSKISRFARYAGLALVAAALAFAAGVAVPLDDYAMPAADPRALVIDDLAIVDVAAGVVRPGQTIVIAGKRIVYAGDSAAAPAHPGALRVSGKGRYAIPGLWDMHVHTVGLSAQLHFPLLIANGVTSVRDMGDGCSFGGDAGCTPDAAAWKARFVAGTLLAPRLVSTASYHVEEAEEGIAARLKARGDRMLKLQLESDADPAAFAGLLGQAQDASMQAAGHLPYAVDLLDASLAPLHSIEHDDSLLPQCSARGLLFDGRNRSKMAQLARFDEARCAAVLRTMASRRIGYVPTHVASSYQDVALPLGDYRRDERVKYVALPQRLLWRAYASMAVAGTGDEDRAPIGAWHKAALSLTGRAQAAGVAVMAGTDAMDPYVTHGFSLHDELALLVKAGLTPAQALRAATLAPARHMGMEKESGSIEAGKLADLVLLSRNPLDNIAATRAIDAVVHDGRLHERGALDAMLSFAERQASSFALNCKFLWALLKP